MTRMIFIFILNLWVVNCFCQNTQADVFSQQDIATNDRAGFSFFTPLIEASTGEKIKTFSQTKQPELKKVDDLIVENMFSQDLRHFIQQDQNIFLDERSLSQNKLLLLSYASPAMADIYKHYRMFTLERLQLEYMKHHLKGLEEDDVVQMFADASLNRCLYRESKKGLMNATRSCQEKPPFAYIKNTSGWYVSDERPWEILKDLLERVGLKPAKAQILITFLGDIQVTVSKIHQKSPTKSLEEEIVTQSQKIKTQWQNILGKHIERSAMTTTDWESLFCEGIIVPKHFLDDLSLLKPIEQEIFMMKFSHNCARLTLHQQLKQGVFYLEQAQHLLGLEKGARKVLENKQKMLENVIKETKTKELLETAETLLKNVSEAADIKRGFLMGDTQMN